jgi:hypothetical protein
MRKRVVLIGGTGTFGSRLAEHLARIPELDIVLTSRSKAKAQDVVNRLISAGAVAKLEAAEFNSARDPIDRFQPWLVIDASGPFQFMDYRTPRAALEVGAHFIDIADASQYLMGFEGALNPLAQARNLVALAGASTTPALTFAVVDHLTKLWSRIDTIDIAIVPGGSNRVGPALVKAILAQASVPAITFRHGFQTRQRGWMHGHSLVIPMLGTFRVTPVDTVDASTMPARYRVTSRVNFSAGLISRLEQWAVEVLALGRRTGLVRRLDSLARILAAGRLLTRHLADDRGGMIIKIRGLDASGLATEAQWSLLARQGHGPHVPTLAAVAAVRQLLEQALPAGARMVQGEIPLDLIEREFAPLAIASHVACDALPTSVFQGVLGASYSQLPGALRDFHSAEGPPVWHGQADVVRGRNLVSRFAGWLIGLPSAGSHPLTVCVEREGADRETWTRTFGKRSFKSVMQRTARNALTESFGPFRFTLGLRASAQGTALPVIDGSLAGIPLPRFLLPTSDAVEFQDRQERFCFDVKIGLPFFGLLAHYRGWLCPAQIREVNDDIRDPLGSLAA